MQPFMKQPMRNISFRPAALLLALFLLLPVIAGAQTTDPLTRDVDQLLAAQDPLWVHLDGALLKFQIPPVIVEGSTYVELNALFTNLNITSAWNQTERKVTGTTSTGRVIELYIGRRDAYIDGQLHWLNAAPFIATPYNRTMMPLSFVATATGASVTWLNTPRTVDILTGVTREVTMFNLNEMSEYIFRGYQVFGEAGPISIVNAVMAQNGSYQNVYLVGLAGTDLAAAAEGNATGLLEDLIVGGWSGENDYLKAVRNTLAAHVPSGSRLIFSGHSLGGMVAQQAAADSWIKSTYNVLHTVTIGSPLIAAGSREGEVRRTGDWNDIVPLLSVEGTILLPWQVAGLQTEDGGYGLLGVLDAHNVSYRREDVWGAYDPVGRKWGDTTFTFWTGNVRYYPAPRL